MRPCCRRRAACDDRARASRTGSRTETGCRCALRRRRRRAAARSACARLAEAAHPVADHADAHAGAGAFGQRVAELAAGRIVAEDVVFEQDQRLRAADRREPRVEIRSRIDQEIDAIAFEQRRAGRAAERLLGKQAHGDVVGDAAGWGDGHRASLSDAHEWARIRAGAAICDDGRLRRSAWIQRAGAMRWRRSSIASSPRRPTISRLPRRSGSASRITCSMRSTGASRAMRRAG